MAKLMGLQFHIVYMKGKENVVAYALSRVGHLMSVIAISEVQPRWLQEVLNSYITDQMAQNLLTRLVVHSLDEQGLSLSQGILRKDNMIYIGNNSAMRTKLISALHDSALGGHSGIQSTYQRIKKVFWWRGLKRDVEDFIKQCSICQHAKSERFYPVGLLQLLPLPQGVWQDLSLDFIEGLPKSDGYSCILVVVDRYSTYAHFFPLHHPFTVAQVFLDNIVKLHGVPKSLVSDRDRVFTSSLWKQLFQLLHTKLSLSAAYHPQSNGQTERVNQCLEMYIYCAVHATPTKWKKWLPLAEFWYNTTFHSALGCTPFKVLYGYDIPFAAAPIVLEDGEQYVVTPRVTENLN
jgi:hypothetical protein